MQFKSKRGKLQKTFEWMKNTSWQRRIFKSFITFFWIKFTVAIFKLQNFLFDVKYNLLCCKLNCWLQCEFFLYMMKMNLLWFPCWWTFLMDFFYLAKGSLYLSFEHTIRVVRWLCIIQIWLNESVNNEEPRLSINYMKKQC